MFAHFDGETDRPDGAAVDSEGCYWCAFMAAPKSFGSRRRDGCWLNMPSLRCVRRCARLAAATCARLYVTTARQKREADELARLPESGGIFAMRVDVAGPARAEVRRLKHDLADHRDPMQLDTTAFIRLDAPNSLGATASGAAFATNTGDILEVGVFRARHRSGSASVPIPVPTTDWSSAARSAATWRSPHRASGRSRSGNARLEIDGRAAVDPAVSGRAAEPRLDHR